MIGPHAFVPALPVLVPLALVAFVLVASRLQQRGALTVPRASALAASCAYGVGVLHAVLLPMPLVLGTPRDGMPPWHVFVNLTPLVGMNDPIGIVLNVALFVPMGLLLPLLLRSPSAARVVGTGFLVSLVIELTQLLADVTVSVGRVADIDDLMANTAGVVIGYALFRVVTWPAARRTDARREPVSAGAR